MICGETQDGTGRVCDKEAPCYIQHETDGEGWGVAPNSPPKTRGSRRKQADDIADGIKPQKPVGPPDLAEVFKNLPVIAYGDTSGHLGSDTSEDRARYMDRSGITAANQRVIVNALGVAREGGITQAECETYLGIKHGSASGALSGMHQKGYLARLAEIRGGSLVYVLPEYVNGRETHPYVSKKQGEIQEAKMIGWEVGHRTGCQGFRLHQVCSHTNPYEVQASESVSA